MLKRRQVLCIEAEATDMSVYTLPSISEMVGLPNDSSAVQELGRTWQTGLQAVAVQKDSEDKRGKAGKAKLQYLTRALEQFPDLATELKRQASAVLSGLETYAIAAIREQRLKLALRVLNAIDQACENGLKFSHRKRHQMRLLHVHAYLALYSSKLSLAIQYVEQAKLLEGKKAHVLLKCTSRLLEAYIYALQLDHKIAMKLLRESLTLQTRHRVPEQISSTDELNWFFRLLVVTLHNLAAESVNLHLRLDALQYVEKAKQIVSENPEIAATLVSKVTRLHAALSPAEAYESVTLPTEVSEEAKLPFLPGGKVEDRPGKIVEVTQETPHAVDDSAQKLPRVTPVNRTKGNAHFAQTPSKRYRSVPPSQRRKLGF